MTQYAKDFSDETTTGIYATDFTLRWGTTNGWTIEAPTDAEDDRTFQSDGTDITARVLTSWDDVDGDANRDNCEVLVRFRQDDDFDGGIYVWARGSGSAANESGYAVTTTSGDWQIRRYATGTSTQLGLDYNADALQSTTYQLTADQDPSYSTIPPDVWTYVRLRVNGTGATVTVQAKFWVDGCDIKSEPVGWMLDYDDTDATRITAAGWIGLGRFTTANQVEFDYISVGTNGDAAPLNASTNTTVRMGTVWAEVIGKDANPNFRMSQHFTQVMGSMTNPSARVSDVGVQVLHDIEEVTTVDLSGQLILTT